MCSIASQWWTDERVNKTISRGFIEGHVPQHDRPMLDCQPTLGEGLTDSTYIDWILEKARKLFLILVQIGIPGRIFDLINEAYDDTDLPLEPHRIDILPLSSDRKDVQCKRKFLECQGYFFVKGINPGDHVIYKPSDVIPVELVDRKTNLPFADKQVSDRVVLVSTTCREFLRLKIRVNTGPDSLDLPEQDEVVDKVKYLHALAHESLISVYASYMVDDTIGILLSGSAEFSLKEFLNDRPVQFKTLSSSEQKLLLLDWILSLVTGVAWLHSCDQAFGVAHPSNIFVDSGNRIFLRPPEAFNDLVPFGKKNDVETYLYAAPEQWIRTASVRPAAPPAVSFPSGARASRKAGPPRRHAAHSSASTPGSSPSASSRNNLPTKTPYSFREPLDDDQVTSQLLHTPPASPTSCASSSDDKSLAHAPLSSTPSPNAPRKRTITRGNMVLQSWQSRQSRSRFPADIFSLAAVCLELLTILCGRKHSAFAQHRGAKNRMAGRGGSVIDCSFHLDRNAGQVSSWIDTLERDAAKYAKRHPAFAAAGPLFDVIRSMLAREPGDRPTADVVMMKVNDAIWRYDAHPECW